MNILKYMPILTQWWFYPVALISLYFAAIMSQFIKYRKPAAELARRFYDNTELAITRSELKEKFNISYRDYAKLTTIIAAYRKSDILCAVTEDHVVFLEAEN